MKRNNCDELVRCSQVRTITPTRRSVSGLYPFRGERSIPFESTLERDFLIRAEFSSVVLDVTAQPVAIPFRARNGREYIHTPDFLVQYRTGNRAWGEGLRPLLVEVKPRAKLRERWQDLKPKFRAALRFAREQGWDFHIYDESRIRDQVLNNILFLRRYRRMAFAQEDIQDVVSSLAAMGQAPFHYLVGRHFVGMADAAVGVSLVWSLLASGLAECDMTRPLSNNTVLWVPCHV